jgi:SpoIID/LytB domain protein
VIRCWLRAVRVGRGSRPVRRSAWREGGSRPDTFRRARLAASLVAVAAFSLSFVAFVGSQGDPTDADLLSASGGVTVAMRSLGTGATAHVPIELYVARVLAGEGEPNAPEATTQALAIAIRTFATFNAGRHRSDGYDLCDSTHCQVPRAATAATRRAAMASAGRILTYNGAAAEVFYSASCGGHTENVRNVWPKADLPYLPSIEDDVHDDDEPWKLELTLTAVQQALIRERVAAGGTLKDVEVESRSESGRVTRLRLEGMRPSVITGDQFRTAMGARQFRSTAFEVERDGRVLKFEGMGYGHGVGMCVIGAGRRARRGESVERILQTYYPGLEITHRAALPAMGLPSVPLPAVSRRAPADERSTPATSLAPAGPVAAAPTPVPRSSTIVARVPPGSSMPLAELERTALAAHSALSQLLGVTAAPVTVSLHESLESFRAATGRSWWVSATAAGTSIELAPAALLAQREGLEATVRTAMAELLVGQVLADRPAWVRIGAARYFARPAPIVPPRSRVQCPSDAELMLAVSAASQREAEARAESCFARELARVKDWRAVR